MKVVFFGTSDFAVPTLEALSLGKDQVLGVVTAPDKKKGRGLTLGFSPVKNFAQKNNLALFQPQDLADSKFLQGLRKKAADVFVLCAYGKILTKEVLQIPKIYAINLHASLLPKFRGAAPVNWAIIKGERQTGITVFKMDEQMDRGDIILQEKVDITSCDTSFSLSERLARLGAKAVLRALELIERKSVNFSRQDEEQATLAPKLKKEDGLINWQAPSCEIYNRVRGLQPWPGAFTYLENKLLKIWQSKIVESPEDAVAGEIVGVDTEKGILVQTGKDQLLITVLQLEGKKKMPVGEFILGHKIKAGQRLGKIGRR